MAKSDKILQSEKSTGKLPCMAGRAFESKLIPHFATIAKLRRTKTWQQIVDHLAELGVKTDTGNVYRFFKRHREKPYPLGREPEDLHAVYEDSKSKPQSLVDNSSTKIHTNADNPNGGQPKSIKQLQAEANALRKAKEQKREGFNFGSLYHGKPLSQQTNV